MKNYVYSFGGGTADGDGKMKEVLGGKGAGLAEMSLTGVPVPPGFTISTEVCTIYFKNGNRVPDEINRQILAALDKLESRIGKKLGDANNPLLVSVRSGAKFSMPGMMNTILNLGLNDKTVEGLAKSSGNPRFAYDSYRRFIQMFGEVALNIDMAKFDEIFDERKHKVKAKLDTDLSAEDLQAIIEQYKKLVQKETKKEFPQDAREQLSMARDAVFRSWWNPKAEYYRRMEKIPDDIGTAANVQAMVFGNLGETSATGVGFTRDPATGKKNFTANFWSMRKAKTWSPASARRSRSPSFKRSCRRPTRSFARSPIVWKQHYRDMQDFEFTIENGKLYMLQTRNGKRTGPAAVRAAIDMVEEGMIDKKEAVLRVQPQQLDQLLHPVLDVASLKSLPLLATGIDASPGAAVGRAAFTSEDAVELGKTGPVILVRKETTPDDIHGMDVAKGILTAVGGKSSHAAVVARGMGRPCIVGAGALDISERASQFTVAVGGKKITVKQGDWISMDGTSAKVYSGQAKMSFPIRNRSISRN